MLDRARALVSTWRIEDVRQTERTAVLDDDLRKLADRVDRGALDEPAPWDGLYEWGVTALSLEGQELLVSLLVEPHGALIDDLAEAMAVDESAFFRIDAAQTVGAAIESVRDSFDWALEIDFKGAGGAGPVLVRIGGKAGTRG